MPVEFGRVFRRISKGRLHTGNFVAHIDEVSNNLAFEAMLSPVLHDNHFLSW